ISSGTDCSAPSVPSAVKMSQNGWPRYSRRPTDQLRPTQSKRMVSGAPSFACSGPNGVTAEVSEALEPRLQQTAAKNLVLAKVEQEARQACVMAKPLITSRV